MRIPFVKMHGCGNDFVVFDARAEPLRLDARRAAAVADRRRGVGCDQVIVIEPPPVGSGADVFMRFRNPDGGEAGACGNGTRCAAALLATPARGDSPLRIKTLGGDLMAEVLADGRVRVDMGPPRLGWRDVPLARVMETLTLDLALGPVAAPAALSMGNPHATFFVPEVAALDVAALGAALERDPLFPEGANIGFAQVLAPDRIRLRVWERGAGLTPACGSGACAALVNAHRRGLTGRAAEVIVDGGRLDLAWREADGHVVMTGPVATAFMGAIDLDAIAA